MSVDESPCVRPSNLQMARQREEERKEVVRWDAEDMNKFLPSKDPDTPYNIDARKKSAKDRRERHLKHFHYDRFMARWRNPEYRGRRAYARVMKLVNFHLPIIMPHEYGRHKMHPISLARMLNKMFPVSKNWQSMDIGIELAQDAAARKRLREKTNGEYDSEDERLEESADWRVANPFHLYWEATLEYRNRDSLVKHPKLEWEQSRYAHVYGAWLHGKFVKEAMPIRRSAPSGLQACLHCAQKGLRCSLTQLGLHRADSCKRCVRDGRPYCVQRLMRESDLDRAFGVMYGPKKVGHNGYLPSVQHEAVPPPGAWAVVDDVQGRSVKTMRRRPFAPFVVFVRPRDVVTNEELEAEVKEILRGEEKVWGGLGGVAVPDNMQMKGGLALPRWNIGTKPGEKKRDFFVRGRDGKRKGEHMWQQYMETVHERRRKDFRSWNSMPLGEYKADDEERERLAKEKLEEITKKRDERFWRKYDQDKLAEKAAGSGKGKEVIEALKSGHT